MTHNDPSTVIPVTGADDAPARESSTKYTTHTGASVTGITQDASLCVIGAEKHPFSPTPIALESAANVAFGHAKDDVAGAAQRYREAGNFPDMDRAFSDMEEALDRLTALGWVPGPERTGTAPGGSGEALGWQPIKSAKTDGTFVLCALPSGHITIAQFCRDGHWRRDVFSELKLQPTHWMALPEPPTVKP